MDSDTLNGILLTSVKTLFRRSFSACPPDGKGPMRKFICSFTNERDRSGTILYFFLCGSLFARLLTSGTDQERSFTSSSRVVVCVFDH
eukprot:1187959-Prorocentrum_minimum.AAC.4